MDFKQLASLILDNIGGQYQIVIGPDVPQLYQEVIALGGFERALDFTSSRS